MSNGRKSKIYMIMGESCSGKNFILQLLINYFNHTPFVNAVLPLQKYTNKNNRADVIKERYNYVSTEFLEKMIKDKVRVISNIEYTDMDTGEVFDIVSYDYLDNNMDYIVIGSPKEYADYVKYFEEKERNCEIKTQIFPILVEADVKLRASRYLQRNHCENTQVVIQKRETKFKENHEQFLSHNLAKYGLSKSKLFKIDNNGDVEDKALFDIIDLVHTIYINSKLRDGYWV